MSNKQYEVRLVEASGELVPQAEFCTQPMSFEMAAAYVRGYASRMSEADFRQGRMALSVLIEQPIKTACHELPHNFTRDRDLLASYDGESVSWVENVNSELRGGNG